MPKKSDFPPLEIRDFRSPEEIDSAVAKLRRRIKDVEGLDVVAAVTQHSGRDQVVTSTIRSNSTILEIFGENSPEYCEYRYLELWGGPMSINMHPSQLVEGTKRGCAIAVATLGGLISRLEERRSEMTAGVSAAPTTYFDRLNLHPRIRDVARDLFMDGHSWEAVFAASKALINYIKERSGRLDLDGPSLVRTVFSKNAPLLAFNDLADQTDQDEQEGMMHLFEGTVQAIRNPGGHSFPEGPDQRAIEYISLLSLLAFRVQGAKRKRAP
jgi:uncharacterized protein (TIGR02391 family)